MGETSPWPPGPDLPLNERGRVYHLDCGPGDIAPYILTCGDPDRARRLACRLDRVRLRRHNREFLTITGEYHGIPVTILATGIGPDNTAIAVVEAAQCAAALTFVRLGSCGALREGIQVGDLIITREALRDENTSHYYVRNAGPVPADPEVLQSLVQAAEELGAPYHVGPTCTTSDFYAGQGRRLPGFPVVDPEKVKRLKQAGVYNLEMEMSVYLTLAQVSSRPMRAGGVCAVFTNRVTGDMAFGLKSRRAAAEVLLLRVGLRALEILYARDHCLDRG
uniref:Uridine phosphorylase n=1 Tax=Desulfobacca acetoxidans TaxID=60893 RepID=A0A7C5EV35_9BACT